MSEVWNLNGRVRFFVDPYENIRVVPENFTGTVVEYLQEKCGCTERSAFETARGYAAPGRVVFFRGAHFGAHSGLHAELRGKALALYREHYSGNAVIYNGVYKGIPGEEWKPILYYSCGQGWNIANGWQDVDNRAEE